MAVSYKSLLHLMIGRDISNAQFMCDANISTNIIMKIKKDDTSAFDNVESILTVGSKDILEFTSEIKMQTLKYAAK